MILQSFKFVLFILALIGSSYAAAVGIGHHGGMILHCEPPVFLDEVPVRESSVASFQQFAVTASENTDAATIKAWVNAQPVSFKISEERSGRFRLEGSLSQPLHSGKAWIKVSGESRDGCDEIFVWNVYLKQ